MKHLFYAIPTYTFLLTDVTPLHAVTRLVWLSTLFLFVKRYICAYEVIYVDRLAVNNTRRFV